jgi:hypothetical protein
MLMACGAPSTQTLIPETETPEPTEPNVRATNTETPIPTVQSTDIGTLVPIPSEFVALPTATPKFAPFCDVVAESTLMAAQCHQPIAEQSSAFCEKKVPYNLISINEGAWYELLNERFQCTDAGFKDGKKLVTCTGPMGLPFELKVCDPACALPSYSSTITRCPEEYTYDTLRSCCTQKLQPADHYCISLRLEAKSCVINCGEFTSQSTCEKYFHSCEWYGEENACRPRNQ